MRLLQALALGLASATTAVASRCKPSAPSSVSSVSPSPSPSTPATPPRCVVNVVQNGYFDGGSLDGWSVSGGVAGSTSCGQYASCAQLDTLGTGYATISQTVPNTGIGNSYTFTFIVRAVSALNGGTLTCQINDGSNGLSWSWTAAEIYVGNYAYQMKTFIATTTSVTIECTLTGSSSDSNPIQVDYFNLNC